MYFQRISLLVVVCAGLVACSKADESKPPQVFEPRLIGQNGESLSALREERCQAGRVDLNGKIITRENFNAVFECANYDRSLEPLRPLVTSRHLPSLIDNLNLVLKSDGTKSMKDTLRDWLQDGPEGTSRADRLLPFLASLIKNVSFQAFLPVFDGILQAGRGIWRDLLPGLADVIYTEAFPDNIENAFVIVSSFSGTSTAEGEGEKKNHAKTVKDLARFLQTDVDGKTASLQAIELVDGIRGIELPGTNIYQFLEHMLEKGTITAWFLDYGAVRGEVVDPKLNEAPDEASVACAGMNETADQRRQCAYERLFKRPANGGDAPITQLAGLVAEFQKDHPDFLPSLAAWFAGNGPRVIKGLSEYVVRAQVITNLSKLNVGNYLVQHARKSGMNQNAPVSAEQFAALLREVFASAEFAAWVDGILPAFHRDTFGERNARFLQAAAVGAEIVALYRAPEVEAFASEVIPAGTTRPLSQAARNFQNRHRSDALLVEAAGRKQNLEKHLGGVFWNAARTSLGEDVVFEYVVKLAQTLLTDMANSFRDGGKPLSEWYFTSPYGNPGTTEMLAGYLVKELDMLPRYFRYKSWLKTEFAEEAFPGNENDKRAFRLLVDQIPHIWLYVKSGMSRSGGDLTRALARDRNNYLVRTYVNLIVNVYETGWLRKGVRLVEAFQQRPGRERLAAAPVSDEIADRRKYKTGLEAFERIYRSLIQPEREGDYSTSTLGRLVTPLSSIVSERRRSETERFLQVSADQVLSLSDEKINDFLGDMSKARPPGTVSERRETFRAVADLLRHESFPGLVHDLSGLFQEEAVRPALDFLREKIDDGSLPRVLLFIRRILGFGSVG